MQNLLELSVPTDRTSIALLRTALLRGTWLARCGGTTTRWDQGARFEGSKQNTDELIAEYEKELL